MRIKDKLLKKLVDVSYEDCYLKECYWPRQDPGSFTQGVGYRHRSDDWLCGTREIHGCPLVKKNREISPATGQQEIKKRRG
jgi:hypothetical protein